mmetsp:Transcript_24020/g.75232  ORF Transcript_24020/g.75232 Transcript_24020/m.75232 type:complete len:318 (-) Transcript_24020:393-1346(-)
MSESDKPLDELEEGGDDASPPTTVKLLIGNAEAGSIIGKGGATIGEFQAQSNARIQLSRNREFFPGTADRVILLSGDINSILTALHLVQTKLLAEDPEGEKDELPVKIVVPNAVCGGIIGKKGSTIRSFVEDSGAQIKISSQEQQLPGVQDRILTVTGSLDQQLRAVALVVTKMSEDPNYAMFASMPINYAPPSAYSLGGAGAASAVAAAAGVTFPVVPAASTGLPMAAAPTGPTTTLVVAVPDEHVGAVVGRGGRTITEIQQVSGVRIKISDRDDFVEGTTNRKVSITGTAEAVQIAQFLIEQKVQSSAADAADIE